MKSKMWMLFFIFLNHLTDFANCKTNDDAQYKTVYACEGHILELVCPSGHFIQLLRANYGRFSISICNEQGNLDWSVDCASDLSYSVIYQRCSEKTRCSIHSSSSLFEDPCPGTLKYLEAHYQCVAESTSTSAPLTSSSTSPTSTSTTTRPPIIIPVTRLLRPSPHTSSSSPVPEPRPPPFSTFPPPPAPPTALVPVFLTEGNNRGGDMSFTTSSSPRQRPFTGTKRPTVLTSSPPPPPVSGFRVTFSATTDFSEEDSTSLDSYCRSSNARNQLWNWTRSGQEVIQKCPSGSTGVSRWKCDVSRPAKWVPSHPDLSDCTSFWLNNLTNKFGAGRSVTKTAEEIAQYTKTKPLYGGDVLHISRLLHAMVDKMGDIVLEMEDETRQRVLLEEFLEFALAIHNNLLESPERNYWKDLPRPELRKAASGLVRGVEKAAWLLAAHQSSGYTFSRAHLSSVVSVRVLEMWQLSEITFPSAEETAVEPHWRHAQDLLILPSHAVIETSSNGLVKLVLTAFSHLETFLAPDDLLLTSDPNKTLILNSRVLGVWVEAFHMVRLRAPLTVVFQHLQVENTSNPQCVYWDLNVRSWRTQGCWISSSNKTHSVCECQLLTNFALIMEVTAKKVDSEETFVLRIVTLIGCALCILLVLITLTVLQLYRCVQESDRVAIHKHFCLCLGASEVIFAGGAHQTGGPWCPFVAGILHYLVLATFAWLALVCFQLFVTLQSPGDGGEKSRMRWFYGLAYGLPLLVVAVAVSVQPMDYGTPTYCWLRLDRYYVFTLVGPVLAAVLVSLVFLVLTLSKMCCREGNDSQKSKEETKLTSVRIWSVESLTVLVVLVLTWSFCIIYLLQSSPTSAYLFALFNTLLGIIVFSLYCIKNDKVCRAFQKSLRRVEWFQGCWNVEHRVGGSQARLYTSANGSTGIPPSALAPAGPNLAPVSSNPQQWGSLKVPKTHLTTGSSTQPRTASTDHLSIAILSREEHPLHSLGHHQSPSSRPRWLPRHPDHIYECIDESNPYMSSRLHQNNLSLSGPANRGREYERSETLERHHPPKMNPGHQQDSAQQRGDRSNIFTSVLQNSPRPFHLFRDSCLSPDVAYSGMLSGTDSSCSGTDNRSTPTSPTDGQALQSLPNLRVDGSGPHPAIFSHVLKYPSDNTMLAPN